MDYKVVYEGNMTKVWQLSDDLYFREANLEIRDQSNSGYIVLNNSVAVIDYPFQNPDEEIIEEAEKVTGKPVKYVLITHAHGDHVNGFRTMHRKDIQIICKRNGLELMYKLGEPVPKIHTAIDKTMDITLDGREIHFEYIPRTAHSPYDLLIGLKDQGVVFTGDMIALLKNMFFHSADITGWIASVDEMIEKNEWKVLARGHGGLIGPEYLSEVKSYLELLYKAMLWQQNHNEEVTAETVENSDKMLSAGLSGIINELKKNVDAKNIARQINQLYHKLRV